MITHENVFILDVLQHQQLQEEKIKEGIRVRTEEKEETNQQVEQDRLTTSLSLSSISSELSFLLRGVFLSSMSQ